MCIRDSLIAERVAHHLDVTEAERRQQRDEQRQTNQIDSDLTKLGERIPDNDAPYLSLIHI